MRTWMEEMQRKPKVSHAALRMRVIVSCAPPTCTTENAEEAKIFAKLGTKKQRKLQEKAEKKAMREVRPGL